MKRCHTLREAVKLAHGFSVSDLSSTTVSHLQVSLRIIVIKKLVINRDK